MNRGFWLAAGLIAAGVALSGCDRDPPATAGSQAERPAQVVRLPGTDVSRVVLTAKAADRLGIKTAAVRAVSAPGARVQATGVPVAALVYDSNGVTWVYTNPERLTFVRQRVTVLRIEGDTAVLQSGPAVGTLVVTVGASELLGSEYGVEGAGQ